MDTEKIRVFLRSAETGSFSKVAEEFNYTPSAISHICDGIEHELGVKLFIRNYSGVKLTEVGTELYKDLREFVNFENEILFKAKSLAKRQKHIRIGVYSSIASSILPKILKNLKKDNPELKISINVLSQEFRQALKSNTVDLVFSADDYGFDYDWLPLFEDPYYIAVPEAIMIQDKTVDKEFVYKYPFIKTEWTIVKKNFDLDKFKEIIDYKTEDYSLALDMVKEGVGITLVPKIAIDKRIKGIKFYKLQPELKRRIGLYYKKQALRRKEIKTLIEYLKNY